MAILGVDLSLTSTGLALLYDKWVDLGGIKGAVCHHGLVEQRDRAWTTSIQTNPKEWPDPFLRWHWIASSILTWANFADLVVIEGYSFGSSAGARASMELGGIVRYELMRNLLSRRIIEIPPSTLKKFVAGSGGKNVDKDQMLLQAYKKWGVEFRTNDECDAYGLAKIGQAFMLGTEGLPLFQTEVIEQLKNPQVKKRRSARLPVGAA